MPDAIDYRPGERVWLTPRTATAPREAYRQPRVTVIGPCPPLVTVRLPGGARLTVHARDLTRTDPTRPRTGRRPAPPPQAAEGGQFPLWP